MLLLLLAGCPAPPPWQEGSFPKNFRWGTATAGFQVEAGCPTLAAAQCEDRNSDWYQFVTAPAFVSDTDLHLSGQPLAAAPGFRELFAADVDRARNELGNNAFRLSIEWSRLFPTDTRGITGQQALRAHADADALAYYHALLDAVRGAGLEPLVTLHHYTLPLWLHDGLACHQDLAGCTRRGWLDPATVDELAKYSGFVAAEFGDQVDWWATQNEPLAVVMAGYLFPSETRTNPPGLGFKFAEGRAVLAAMQVAHARQYDAVKQADVVDADGDGQASQVGLVYNLAPSYAADPSKPVDVQAQRDIDYLYNQVFLDGVVLGKFDQNLDGNPVPRADLAGRMDYLGVNYYTRIVAGGVSGGQPVFPDLSPFTAFNPLDIQQGEDFPRGIYEALIALKRYHLPLIVTENGADDHLDDGRGERFLVEHLAWVARAIRDGADVRGYFWWTLLDNYEWNHGMAIRMGLYAVDAADPSKTRVARRSVPVYRRIAEANAIPEDLLAQYPIEE